MGAERLRRLRDTVGPLTRAPFISKADRDKDSHVLFRCGDKSARQSSKRQSRWYDKDFENRFPLIKYTAPGKPICADRVRAGTVDTYKDDPNEVMPHHIIYLCESALDGTAIMGNEWKDMWTG